MNRRVNPAAHVNGGVHLVVFRAAGGNRGGDRSTVKGKCAVDGECRAGYGGRDIERGVGMGPPPLPILGDASDGGVVNKVCLVQ